MISRHDYEYHVVVFRGSGISRSHDGGRRIASNRFQDDARPVAHLIQLRRDEKPEIFAAHGNRGCQRHARLIAQAVQAGSCALQHGLLAVEL